MLLMEGLLGVLLLLLQVPRPLGPRRRGRGLRLDVGHPHGQRIARRRQQQPPGRPCHHCRNACTAASHPAQSPVDCPKPCYRKIPACSACKHTKRELKTFHMSTIISTQIHDLCGGVKFFDPSL